MIIQYDSQSNNENNSVANIPKSQINVQCGDKSYVWNDRIYVWQNRKHRPYSHRCQFFFLNSNVFSVQWTIMMSSFKMQNDSFAVTQMLTFSFRKLIFLQFWHQVLSTLSTHSQPALASSHNFSQHIAQSISFTCFNVSFDLKFTIIWRVCGMSMKLQWWFRWQTFIWVRAISNAASGFLLVIEMWNTVPLAH